MLVRLVLISVLIPSINVVISSRTAVAQTSDACTFTQPTPGDLVAKGAIATKLESSSAVGGSPTEISVSCNQPVQLTVSAPFQVSGPTFSKKGRGQKAEGRRDLSLPQNA